VDWRGLSRIGAVAANTFRETVRERVLYNLVFFAIAMMLSGFLLSQLSIRQDERILKNVGLAAMEIFGTAIAIFIGVGLVSKEIERRSLYPLLAKPLTRTELFLGKFAGLSFTLVVNVSVMALGLFTTLVATGWPADLHLLRAIYPIVLSLLLVVAIAQLFSALTSSTLASVCTFSVVVAGRYSSVIRDVRAVAPGVPRWLAETIYFALPNFGNFDFKYRVVYGEAVPASLLAWVTAYAAAYVAILLAVGAVAFKSRDLH
jgi:ABC-type transport system involved in multi-copper enzyme maturation permease subunit